METKFLSLKVADSLLHSTSTARWRTPTLQRTPESPSVLAGAGAGVGELCCIDAEEADNVELNDKGELIGIEILEASSFIRDSILESAQAKMLDFSLSHNEAIAADH